MESNNESKETDINNRAYYYFDNIANINDLDLDNILFDEKPYDNFSVYYVTQKIHAV